MMDTPNHQSIVYSGWLIKSPPEQSWKTKWRRRWFVLRLAGQIPGQYVLEYYVDQTCKKLKGTIDLDQCEQVDAGLQLEFRNPEIPHNYEHIFDLRTTKRTYILVARTEEDMNKWVECICAVCGLKIESVSPNDTLPVLDITERYSPQPSQSEQQQHSTSESSIATLNYIPISECYTGRRSPPPRPPKPAALQLNKSQSSLALWPPDQTSSDHLASTTSHPTPTKQQLRPQVGLPPKSKVLPSTMLATNRPFYLNSSRPNQMPVNYYDTWHSGSAKAYGSMLVPPQVNRQLKPQRRRNVDSSVRDNTNGNHGTMHPTMPRNASGPMSMGRHHHTLPRPPPTSYSLRALTEGDKGRQPSSYAHLSHCEQPRVLPRHIEDCERQYLDLDLDSESTNSQSPRTPQDPAVTNNSSNSTSQDMNTQQNAANNIPNTNGHTANGQTSSNALHQIDLVNNNTVGQLTSSNGHTTNALGQSELNNNSSTVYKQVDFIKTKAFNKMRLNVNMYRNAN